MSLQGTIQLGPGDVAVVDSLTSFNEFLARVEARAHYQPIMINLIARDGRSLSLGLGRSNAVLSLAGPHGDPPYFASVGDEKAAGSMSFDYHGETTEFRLRHAVPISAARAAAEQFLSDSELPSAVRWEEV